MPEEVVEEGIQVMEEFFHAWSSQETTDGEDVIMAGTDSQEIQARTRDLQKCLEQFRPRIENNRWLQSVLSSL